MAIGDENVVESGDQDGEENEVGDGGENKENTSETKEGTGDAEKEADASVGEQGKKGESNEEANGTPRYRIGTRFDLTWDNH